MMETKVLAEQTQNVTVIDVPPYDGGWKEYLHTQYNPRHFWSAFKNNHITGTVVNQLGSKHHDGGHYLHVGYTNNGYLYPSFKPSHSGLWLYKLNYNPISVSDIQRGVFANTIVRVKMELWELPNKYVGSAKTVLYPHSKPGTLQFAKYVSKDKKYKFYFYTQVYIGYKENSEAYGEAIVNFQSVMSKLLISGYVAEESPKGKKAV